MPPRGDRDADERDDLLSHLKPNAPVSVVRAAKASLKEPSRPFTPVDRHLFNTNDYAQNRLSTAHGLPTSKNFYEHNPKLSVPRMADPYSSPRTDSYGKSILDNSRSMERSSSSMFDPNQDSITHGLMRSSSRGPTAAETVAALKASLATEGKPLQWPAVQTLRLSDEDGAEILDPRRNDDLPTRPTTSRGRPSSALVNEQMSVSDRFDVPPPSVLHAGGAEVLDMNQTGSDGSSTDDEEYRHMYNYSTPRPAEELSQAPLQQDQVPGTRSEPPGTAFISLRSSSGRPAPPADTTPVDPGDPLAAWRQAVEVALARMASSTSAFASATGPAQRDALTELIKNTSELGSQVEFMRKQPNSSRWLNVACLTFRDASSGQPFSIREAISEHVFRLMDSTNAELLIKGCGIVLRVVKSRLPLLQASKLLYRLSKDTANDALFRKEKLLEPIIRTVSVMVASSSSTSGPSSMHEPLVYLNGCLKNVSNDTSNQKALVKLGALHVMAGLLKQMSTQISAIVLKTEGGQASVGVESASPESSSSDLALQVTVQATGILRNLAVSPSHAEAFVTSSVIQALRTVAQTLAPPSASTSYSSSTASISDASKTAAGRQQPSNKSSSFASSAEEVILNVARILSKLSLHDACQAAFEGDLEYVQVLTNLLRGYSDQRAILLRITFVLGNLTTSSDGYRKQIADVGGAVDMIVSILHQYAQSDQTSVQQHQQSQGVGQRSERALRSASKEDCVVKLLRLVANLAIHQDVGPQLAGQVPILEALQLLLGQYSYIEADELVLNCVCALTNLSFYHGVDNKVLSADPSTLLSHVTPLLLCDNDEAMVEAARAYGNFSRVPAARVYMQEARVLEAMLLLLDHSNYELLYSICGTLINFTIDSGRKSVLVSMGGVARLVEVLERVVTSAEITELEVAILTVVFKALYNVCADDAQPGIALSERPAVSEEEIMNIEAIVEHIRSSEDFNDHEELSQLSEKLVGQLGLISRKLDALNLEPL
ncbi:hypothetical protein CEUSTIGMA_g5465.t1 [Chlamydomonas eustigma]|uniref:Armadillo repeat-containing domain-containing protein n=1 Tax=Chlamydomonas eustigma TaxID=1157962 RepID=A0A250X4L9_9CHLO|nr:hypothetical protein CEUSTIGMA_g5465.t1 [Chlamydomonas eustigma]|eukprot:GAX78023.1 hypothetical protein CEUSTIGMA_g5465.t1 [Chlamydomonas eustigma]